MKIKCHKEELITAIMNVLNNWMTNDTAMTTNDSFSTYIDPGFFYNKNYWALLLLVLCISVVFGNVLVILSVAKERSLQNITNYFIVSLAVADLCVAGVVMPFYAYTMVRRSGEKCCFFQNF